MAKLAANANTEVHALQEESTEIAIDGHSSTLRWTEGELSWRSTTQPEPEHSGGSRRTSRRTRDPNGGPCAWQIHLTTADGVPGSERLASANTAGLGRR